VPLKKIISFALWGDNPLYVNGAIWNAEHGTEFYPGWICRFYHDDSVPAAAIEKIRVTGAEMKLMGRTSDVLGMYWRFHPMFDDAAVERFIVRDTDSKLSDRESKMVAEWEASGKSFHIIRDHRQHNISMLGGTWGSKTGVMPNFERLLCGWMTRLNTTDNPRGLFFGTDQMFLHELVWPFAKQDHIAHVRAGVPELKLVGNEIEVPDPEDGHFVGMPS
jgi:hypothetical protein